MDKRGLPLVWLQGVDNKTDFELTLRNSTLVLSKLKQIIESKIDFIDASETDIDFFAGDALAKIAFNRGQKKSLQDLLSILSFV